MVSETFLSIVQNARAGRVLVSRHGLKKINERSIEYDEIVAGIESAETIEDYPDYIHGPSVLVLQSDFQSSPIHVLWGLRRGGDSVAVLVTAYRPDPVRWDRTMKKRVAHD